MVALAPSPPPPPPSLLCHVAREAREFAVRSRARHSPLEAFRLVKSDYETGSRRDSEGRTGAPD